jgi:hypothetical protein
MLIQPAGNWLSFFRLVTESKESSEKSGFVWDFVLRTPYGELSASSFRPKAGNWLCFFKFFFAVRSTQYEIIGFVFSSPKSRHGLVSLCREGCYAPFNLSQIGFVFSNHAYSQ